jgi:hypothetical protein
MSPRARDTSAGYPWRERTVAGGGGKEVSAMAITKEHHDRLTQPSPDLADWPPADDRVPAPGAGAPARAAAHRPASAARKPLEARLREPIARWWAVTAGVAWPLLLTIGVAVEPPPANPDAVDPWFVSALSAVLLAAMLATVAGLSLRRRWGMAASLAAAGMLVASTVLCPVSGHHAGVGAWWVVQLGCGLGLVAVSALGLRHAGAR